MSDRWQRFLAGMFLIISSTSSTFSLVAFASTECKKVRFSDVGWSDITATTALASAILEGLGYEPKAAQLSVPVTYVSLKNRDLDVFLGNWMPAMAGDIGPYKKAGTVETVGTLLRDARYTLAVPRYVYDAGVHSVSDLAKYRDRFGAKIYGIEAGNDGNRLVSKMIADHIFGPSDWKLIQSSEQAMLMEVLQAVKHQKWVVFLGWEPHPMNTKIQMNYLTGADAYFGPNQGSSQVYINTRKDYSKECPNVAGFLRRFSLTIEDENQMMTFILDQGLSPKVAAKKWMAANWSKMEGWLQGVQSVDGKPAMSVLKKAL